MWKASQQTPPHYGSQPAKSENRNSNRPEASARSAGPKRDEKRNQKSEWYSTFSEHPTEWLLAAFTGILALYTARLFHATAGLVEAAREQSRDLKRSIVAAEKAAEATSLNAKAAVRAEQAHVYPIVDREDIVDAVRAGGGDNREINVSFRLKNLGKTPATIIVAGHELVQATTTIPPSPPT